MDHGFIPINSRDISLFNRNNIDQSVFGRKYQTNLEKFTKIKMTDKNFKRENK